MQHLKDYITESILSSVDAGKTAVIKKIITDKVQFLKNPDAPISKALLLALVDKATGGTNDKYKNRNADHWGRNHLDSLCDKAIINTPSAWTDFNGQVNKGQAIALICKAFNVK